MTTNPFTYKDAGVDIDAAAAAKKKIRDLARATFTPGVLSEIGGFGGLFECKFSGISDPVLVSSTDGAGTKLKVAVMMNRHNTVGADLVHHCVNDILVHGARPLFFMDYIAMGRLNAEVLAAVVEGIAQGCREAGCALIGGETAEMPGFYGEGEYDVAGFIVGVVARSKIIDGKSIRPGDLLVGLPSAGLHTNGYSLARKLFFEVAGWTVDSFVDELGTTAGEELLKPHLNYEPMLRDGIERNFIKGLAHITGGGITNNLPRILPDGCQAEVQRGTWPVLPIFKLMAQLGRIELEEMLRATNMGLGMIVVVRPSDLQEFVSTLKTSHFLIGRIVEGEPRVVYRT